MEMCGAIDVASNTQSGDVDLGREFLKEKNPNLNSKLNYKRQVWFKVALSAATRT